MTEPLRAQLVRAVRNHDDAALGRLYDQIDAFATTHAPQHAKLPAPLRRHAAARTAALDLRREWEARAAAADGEDPGPPLWPLWSHARPPAAAPAADPPAAVQAEADPDSDPDREGGKNRDKEEEEEKARRALAELGRKYAKRKKQVHHFESWYTDFEAANRQVVEQLNLVYRRLRAAQGQAVDADAPWLPLDDVAEALLDVTEETDGNTKS